MRFLITIVSLMVIWASYSVQAQDAPKPCDLECLRQKIDALEHKVEVLTTQINLSIIRGQSVSLKTQGSYQGCLTYIGPSGDQGGPVTWSTNCSRGISWTID